MMTRRRELWLILSLTVVTFALRVTDLDARSLWLDEGFTLLRVNGSWSDMAANTIVRQGVHTTDLHPPLYFAILKVWREWAGDSVFALRLFSALWATLVVPLTYVLGRRLFASARVGLLSAVLAMLCAAYQWYAAEIRMYTMVAGLGAASAYFAYRAAQSATLRNAWLVTWLLTTAASLFTHFSLASLALGQFTLLAAAQLARTHRWSDIRSSRSVWLGLAATLLAFGVLLIIGAPTIARVAQLAGVALQTPRSQGVSPSRFLYEIIGATIFGMNADDPAGGWLIGFVGLLACLGICLPFRSRQHGIARLWLAASVIVPIAFWLSLSNFIENYPSFRYIIFIVPTLHIAIAQAVHAILPRNDRVVKQRGAASWPTRLSRLALGSLSLVVVVGAAAFGLVFAFVRSPTWQDDWRGMAAYLRQQWQPGDAIMININTPEALLPVYLRDLPAPITTVNDWAAYPVEEARRIIAEQYQRVWYANTGGDDGYQNPEARFILQPFLLRSRVSFPARTTIIELLEYDLHPLVVEALPAGARPVDGGLPGQTVIAGYRIEPGNPYHTHANFRLSLYWRRGDDDLVKRNAVVRLKAAGRVWLDWKLPASLIPHPESWQASMLYRMSYVIPVPPGLPAQPYTLELQVRAGDKDEPVQTFSEVLQPSVVDCCIRVARSDADASPRWRADDVALVRLEYPDVIRPGESLPIVLTWQAAGAAAVPWQTRLTLWGLLGGELSAVQRTVGTPDFPADRWPAGEWVRDPYALDVPFTARAGWYLLQMQRWRGGRRVDSALLGLVRVEDYPRAPTGAQVQHSVNAQVGELSLLGYSVNGPIERGRTYDFITHWRVEQTPTRDGVLFLHMLAPDGRLVSQDDNPPIVNGAVRSTLTYRPGDGIDQPHRLTIPDDLPAGEYRLLAGVYDRSDGLRWPARQNGQPARDDLILVGVITLN